MRDQCQAEIGMVSPCFSSKIRQVPRCPGDGDEAHVGLTLDRSDAESDGHRFRRDHAYAVPVAEPRCSSKSKPKRQQSVLVSNGS